MEITLKQIKAASLFCEKPGAGKNYHHIFFEEKYVVATNGAILLVLPVTNDLGPFSVAAGEFSGIKEEIVRVDETFTVNDRVKLKIDRGGRLPWRRIVPASLEAGMTNVAADYDSAYLNTIGKAAKLLTGTHYFKLYQSGAEPGVAVFNGLPGAFALIMPLRFERLKGDFKLVLPADK